MITPEPFLFAGFFATLCLLCISLALIDLRSGIIPDTINLAIAVLGLIKALIEDSAATGLELIVEAIVVAAVFWLFRRLYFMLRKIQGLGLGDVKFLGAATLWVGVAGIPMLLLIAALSALLVIGGARLAGQSLTRQTSLPFGPFLAFGLLAALAAQGQLGLM